MSKTLINQSLIKKFFYKGELRDYCPFSVNATSIAKTHNSISDSMNKGSYFETLCLGGSANNSATDDLPRKKLTAKQILAGQKMGDKTIDQTRIEQQHLVFERQKAIYQINVQALVNTQVRVYKQWSKNDDILIHGEHDIFPTTILLPERGIRLASIDLKLTGSFSDFGEYCWLTPSAMDHTQGYMYHELARDIDLQLNMDIEPNNKLQDLYTGAIKKQLELNELLFFYWVFTYKQSGGQQLNKFVEVPWNTSVKTELNETIRKTVEQINKQNRNGWIDKVSSKSTCQGCPVLECTQRFTSSVESNEHNQFESI